MKYIVTDIDYVKKNQAEMLKDIELAYERFNFAYGDMLDGRSATGYHKYYNLMLLTFGSKIFHTFFTELKERILDYMGHPKERLWYMCWLNYDTGENKFFRWHQHYDARVHGFVSIEPQKTVTEFEDFKLKNEVGQMYIGPGNKLHKVNILEPYKKPRISIAFDVCGDIEVNKMYKKYGKVDINIAFLPL